MKRGKLSLSRSEFSCTFLQIVQHVHRDRLIDECEEHYLFLRMLIPKHKWQQEKEQRESVRIVSRDGALVEASSSDPSDRGSSKFKGEWHKDPAVISRHQRLAQRQYFMNRK